MNRAHDPLDGVEVLIVDGTNLLHALRRPAPGGSPPPPAATLVGRLRGLIPPTARIELVFDGPPDRGSRDLRVASGVNVRFAGHLTADALIARLVAGRSGGDTMNGPMSAEHATRAAISTLVVTDDIELGSSVRKLGARTLPSAWLVGQLARTRLVSPSVARPRGPVPQAAAPDDDRRRWRPGRGSTTKRGNPHRGRPDPRRGEG